MCSSIYSLVDIYLKSILTKVSLINGNTLLCYGTHTLDSIMAAARRLSTSGHHHHSLSLYERAITVNGDCVLAWNPSSDTVCATVTYINFEIILPAFSVLLPHFLCPLSLCLLYMLLFCSKIPTRILYFSLLFTSAY